MNRKFFLILGIVLIVAGFTGYYFRYYIGWEKEIGNELEKTNLIRINSPRPNEVVSSPLKITGEARGFWFFEASFPISIEDENGNILAQHYIMTASEWMTEDFVPFEGELTFSPPSVKKGWLVLSKDNPSGLPEHNDELRIPVNF